MPELHLLYTPVLRVHLSPLNWLIRSLPLHHSTTHSLDRHRCCDHYHLHGITELLSPRRRIEVPVKSERQKRCTCDSAADGYSPASSSPVQSVIGSRWNRTCVHTVCFCWLYLRSELLKRDPLDRTSYKDYYYCEPITCESQLVSWIPVKVY